MEGRSLQNISLLSKIFMSMDTIGLKSDQISYMCYEKIDFDNNILLLSHNKSQEIVMFLLMSQIVDKFRKIE